MSSTLTRASLRGAAVLALFAAPVLVQAQNTAQVPETITKEAWLMPPAEVASVVLAPRYLNVSLNNPSPSRKQFMRLVTESMPTQAQFAKPHYYLGGVQIDWKANRARSLTTRGSSRIELLSPEDGKTITIAAPEGATIAAAQWSPNGAQVAYLVNFDDATHLYVAESATGKTKRISKTPLLATHVTQPEWGANRLFVVAIPDGRGAPPVAPSVPTTPQVRMTTPSKNPQRTYNPGGLLEWPIDQDRLEYYSTGQLVAIDAASGAVTKVGAPAMITAIDASPDGNYVRVTSMQRPFSYIVPTSNFGNVEEIWSVDGKVKVQLNKRALRDGSPADTAGQGTRQEKRNLAWRPDGQGISYLLQDPAPARGANQANADSAADERPQQGQARRKDRLYQWLPPFDANSAKVIYESDARLGNVRYSENPQLLFLTEGNAPGGGFGGGGGGGGQGAQGGGQVHEYAVYLNEPTKKYTIARYRSDDFYNLPGTLVTKRGPNGLPVVQTSADGNSVFLEGTQYSKNPQQEAPRPFLDKVDIKTGQKTRVFQSAADVHESVASILDDNASRLIIDRQSATQVPDSYLRDASGQTRKITNNKDYSPEITAAPRKLVEVTRPTDGFKFWVRVTLPPNFSPQSPKPPAMFWFYPREFDSQEAYDRGNRAYNKNAFPNVSTRDMDILTKLGYTVVEPDAPIVGATGRMNDNYVHDLRSNLAATIDELDRLGYIDRTRLGVGGHSYGAFSTVNAMVHTPFFKAGIAGDGNYNRTLTPNAFQSERRLLWDARETYLSMSPFLYANQLTGALLLYHGQADQNVGTDLINSYRLFNALEGLGKTASLYVYPFEDHGPATKETNLDMWARWVVWLDTYVKNANKKTEVKVTTQN